MGVIKHTILAQKTWIAAGVGVVSLGTGIYREARAKSELNKLNAQPNPVLSETPEMRASRMRADDMAQAGFTAPENAAYQQNYARSRNTAYQNALGVSPNLAGAINAGLNYTDVGAINQHAAADAQLHRSNIKYADSFNQTLQNIANQNIQTQIRQRDNAYRQLGLGAQAGLNEINSGLDYGAIAASGAIGGNKNNLSYGTDSGAGLGSRSIGNVDTGYTNQSPNFYDPLGTLRVRKSQNLTGYF